MNLEQTISSILQTLATRGYFLYRLGYGPDKYKYAVRRPTDLAIVEDHTAQKMQDPASILSNPWASGALMFGAYQFEKAPQN